MFDPEKVKGIDFSSLDKNRLIKILEMIEKLPDKDIDLLCTQCKLIGDAEDKRQALMNNLTFLLKIAGIVTAAII